MLRQCGDGSGDCGGGAVPSLTLSKSIAPKILLVK